MKLEPSQESISQLLGLEEKTVLKSPSADLFSMTLTNSARVHQTFRLHSAGGQLPFVVIPADSDLGDFFATGATYYVSQSPLTAYMHVLGKELKECFEATQPEIVPNNGGLSCRQLALLGACLGETTLAALGSNEASLNPSYSACKRSLGYAFARAAALYPRFEANKILDRWIRLRRLTGLAISQSAVQSVCAIHAAASDKIEYLDQIPLPSQLKKALMSYVTTSDENNTLQDALLECYPRLKAIEVEFNSGPFDARMGSFSRAAEEIQRSSQGVEMDSVAVGYFCNKILPGSFAHGKVLTRLVEFFPSALVWYGMFCSTSLNFDVRRFGNGLFEKLNRDISQPFSFAQRPQCDLSLDELEVLIRASVRSEIIKPIQQKIASVALLPGLDVYSRFTADDDSHRDRGFSVLNPSVSDERLSTATQLLDEAVSLLHQLGAQESTAPLRSKSQRPKKK